MGFGDAVIRELRFKTGEIIKKRDRTRAKRPAKIRGDGQGGWRWCRGDGDDGVEMKDGKRVGRRMKERKGGLEMEMRSMGRGMMALMEPSITIA